MQQYLMGWRDPGIEQVEVFYWRTSIGKGVDFVVETAGGLLLIEVKTTQRARFRDAAHLRTFRPEYGEG